MASNAWSNTELIDLRDAVQTHDVEAVSGFLEKIGKRFPRKNKQNQRFIDSIYETVARFHDARYYTALRKIGMPRFDGAKDHLFGGIYQRYMGISRWNSDPREPTKEQVESIADFVSVVLGDGYRLEEAASTESEYLRSLFACKMHDYVDLLSGLEAAGYATLPTWSGDWNEIIDHNNIAYANYCVEHGAAAPSVPLVIGGGVNGEMLEWLISHSVPLDSVHLSACQEVLERCLELGVPPVGRITPSSNSVPYAIRKSCTDDTMHAPSVAVSHLGMQALENRLAEGGEALQFRVYDGVLKEYRGVDEDVATPEGVKSIAGLAFCENDYVKRVRVSEGVGKIEAYAFVGCRCLEEVYLPASLEELSYLGVFQECVRLRSIEVSDTSQSFESHDGVLCDWKHAVLEYPLGLLSNNVLSIPEGVESCDFQGDVSAIKRLIIPASLKSFSAWASNDWRGLERFEVMGDAGFFLERDGALYQKTPTATILYAFPRNAGIEVFEVSEDCSVISRRAFAGCSTLKVAVKPTVRSVGERAFAGCGEVEVRGAYLPFDESALAPTLGTALMVPDMPISSLPQKLKGHAALGYIHLVCEGQSLTSGVNEEYTKYIRSQKKRFIPLMVTDAKVAEYLLNEGLIPKKDVPMLEELADESGNEDLKQRVSRYASRPKSMVGWREERIRLAGPVPQETTLERDVEPYVGTLLEQHEVSPKVGAQIRDGIMLADGSGASSPEAVQLLVELCAVPRKVAYTARYSSTNLHPCSFLSGKTESGKTINELAELFDKEALSEGLTRLFYDKHVPEALVALCRFGNDGVVKRLVESMKAWDKWDGNGGSRKDLAIARGALMYNDSMEAMRHFESIKMLSWYASAHGTTEDALRDNTLSNFGFDRDGRKVFDLGAKTVTATIGDDLKIELFDDEAGKAVRSIPKRGADPDKYEEANAELAEMRKQIRTIVKQRKDLLLEDFLSGRERRIGAWKAAYLENPVLRSVARLIVWQKGDVTFTVMDGMTVDASGTPVKLPAGGVKVAHPVEMKKGDIEAWRAYFATRGLRQPFAQVWEKVVPKTSIKKDRYKGYPIPVYRFKGQEKHGIQLDLGGYNDRAVTISFGYDTAKCVIKQLDFEWHSLKNRVEITSFAPVRGASPRKLNHLVAYLDRMCFYPRLASNDLTVMDDLNDPTLEQLIDYANIASENGATELAAALLAYREERYPEYGSVESLLL